MQYRVDIHNEIPVPRRNAHPGGMRSLKGQSNGTACGTWSRPHQNLEQNTFPLIAFLHSSRRNSGNPTWRTGTALVAAMGVDALNLDGWREWGMGIHSHFDYYSPKYCIIKFMRWTDGFLEQSFVSSLAHSSKSTHWKPFPVWWKQFSSYYR